MNSKRLLAGTTGLVGLVAVAIGAALVTETGAQSAKAPSRTLAQHVRLVAAQDVPIAPALVSGLAANGINVVDSPLSSLGSQAQASLDAVAGNAANYAHGTPSGISLVTVTSQHFDPTQDAQIAGPDTFNHRLLWAIAFNDAQIPIFGGVNYKGPSHVAATGVVFVDPVTGKMVSGQFVGNQSINGG